MAAPLSVWVNIGAKVGPSLNAAVLATERRFGAMGRQLKLIGAEAKVALRSLEAGADRRRGGLFEAGALGFGAMRMLRPMVEFEDALVRFGNTAQIYGSALEGLGRNVTDAGVRFGFAGKAALAGANDYVAAGYSSAIALSALAPTLMLARTAGVEVTEASQAGISVMQNLGVAVRDVGAAFDIMAKAGREGRFEVNDMAKAFPGVASRASSLGMVGLDGVRRMAAMLQITRINARDADEGANNLLNFLDKLTGNETLQHFQKMGVSIEQVWADAKRTGVDFTETMLDHIDRLTKGGTDPIALTNLFPDRQARQAAAALLANRREYERIKNAVSASAGVLEADWKRIEATSKTSLERVGAAIVSIGTSLSSALGPSIVAVADRLAEMAAGFAKFSQANPELVGGMAKVAVGLIGLRIATAGLTFVFGGLATAALQFGRAIWRTGVFLGPLLARMAPLRLAMVAARYGIMAAVAVSAPFVAVLVAIGVALAFIVAKWEGIKAFFSGFAEGFAKGIGPALPAIRELASTLGTVLSPIAFVFSAIGTAVSAVVGWFGQLFGAPAVGQWRSAGEAVGQVVGGIAGGIARLVNWVTQAITKITALWALVSAAPGNVGGWIGRQLGSGPGIAGARAGGGPVSAGSTYLVGERGPELWTAERSGTIIANSELQRRRAVRDGGNTYNMTVNVNGGTDPQATARAVEVALKRMAGRQSASLSD